MEIGLLDLNLNRNIHQHTYACFYNTEMTAAEYFLQGFSYLTSHQCETLWAVFTFRNTQPMYLTKERKTEILLGLVYVMTAMHWSLILDRSYFRQTLICAVAYSKLLILISLMQKGPV